MNDFSVMPSHVEGLSTFWESGTFSDLKVHALDTGGKEHIYKVHKVIVCAKSEFFRRMLCGGGGWKEAADGAIDMTEDDPGIVEAMLKYMYFTQYNYWHENDVSFEDKLMYHARIHAAAIKYCVQGLPQNAVCNFKYYFDHESEEYRAKALVQLIPFLDAEIPEETFSGIVECLAIFVAGNLGDMLQHRTYCELLADYPRFAADVGYRVKEHKSHSIWSAVPDYSPSYQQDRSPESDEQES